MSEKIQKLNQVLEKLKQSEDCTELNNFLNNTGFDKNQAQEVQKILQQFMNKEKTFLSTYSEDFKSCLSLSYKLKPKIQEVQEMEESEEQNFWQKKDSFLKKAKKLTNKILRSLAFLSLYNIIILLIGYSQFYMNLIIACISFISLYLAFNLLTSNWFKTLVFKKENSKNLKYV